MGFFDEQPLFRKGSALSTLPPEKPKARWWDDPAVQLIADVLQFAGLASLALLVIFNV